MDAVLTEYVHPIPPPTEPLQYRAIGLIRGRYQPSDEQFTQGTLLTQDGVVVDAVLLGRVMSLARKHLDLSQDHLWVVYPRTRSKPRLVIGGPPPPPFIPLHMQLVGVWEPQRLHPETAPAPAPSLPMPEDYFSVRGEVLRDTPDSVAVRIRQTPLNLVDEPRSFRLVLKGRLPHPGRGAFWDFQVVRKGSDLVIDQAHLVAPILPPRKKRVFNQRPAPRRSGPVTPTGPRADVPIRKTPPQL